MRTKISSYELLCEMLKAIPEGDACLEWPRARALKGYGELTIQGKHRKAHRVAYEISVGPIPKGMQVCHRCDNPACFRPSHLWAGSNADNSHDRELKGRGKRVNLPHGIRHHSAKLTEDQVREIRELVAQGWTHRALGARLGVSHRTIGGVAVGKKWKYLK
jgi:hypothetical protein